MADVGESVLVLFAPVNLKNTQPENCDLSFIWGKITTYSWEIASQVALQNLSEAIKEELGYMGVFATKGREQEQKRPGLTEIIPLICTSTIRASILSFHSLQDEGLSPWR